MSQSDGSSDFCDHQGSVIGKRSALREPIHLAQNHVGNFRSSRFMVLFDQLHKPCGAEELALAVHGLRDSVRMKHKNVSRIERNSPFVVSDFFEDRKSTR